MQLHVDLNKRATGLLHDSIFKLVFLSRCENNPVILSHSDFCRSHIPTNGNLALATSVYYNSKD